MRKSLIIFGVVLVAILVLYIKYYFRPYSSLPKLSEKYLVIEKEDGIKGFCKVGQSIRSAITSLGRPSLCSEDWDSIPPLIEVEYEDYGLSLFGSYDDWYRLKPVKPKLFQWIILHEITIKITEKNRDKIRLYDERKIDSPVKIETIYELYGRPKIITEWTKQGDYASLLKKDVPFRFNFKNGRFHLVYHFENSYVSFWCKNKEVEMIEINYK